MAESDVIAFKTTAEGSPTEGDWFLRSLVDLVDGAGISFGVTLNVGGTVLTGQLISGGEYFRGFAAEFGDAAGDTPFGHSMREVLAKPAEQFEDVPEEHPLPAFIHLKDARMFLGSGPAMPTSRGVWWRGRISEVQGFVLGSLSVG